MRMVAQDEIVENPRAFLGPHVVLLGAGASLAAFPHGDASSRRIPLMNDLVETLGLRPIMERCGLSHSEDFEGFYSKLASDPSHDVTRKEIEREVETYFSAMVLPEEATVYDRILLSLRPEDAVFTFNWDPFLFDAYERNFCKVNLPRIFFLHGNVRIGRCPKHKAQWGRRHRLCPTCGEAFTEIPLLYPVDNKKYSKDPYVSDSWDNARFFFRQALVLTIFGYSAPTSDAAAKKLLKSAWMKRSSREMEHVEVIDIIPESDLYARWKEFTPTGHFHPRQNLDRSWIARWPRRSREAVYLPMSGGIPCHEFPLADTNDLVQLQSRVREIARWETGARQKASSV